MGHFVANGRTITACGEKCARNSGGSANSNDSSETTCRKCKHALQLINEDLSIGNRLQILVRVSEDPSPDALEKAQQSLDRALGWCSVLGPRWKPRIWENLGWHWQVVSGSVALFPSFAPTKNHTSIRFRKVIGWTAQDGSNCVAKGSTPMAALRAAQNRFQLEAKQAAETANTFETAMGTLGS